MTGLRPPVPAWAREELVDALAKVQDRLDQARAADSEYRAAFLIETALDALVVNVVHLAWEDRSEAVARAERILWGEDGPPSKRASKATSEGEA